LRGVFQPNDFEFGVIVDSQQYLITFCIDLTDQHGIGEGAGKAWSPQTAERSTRKMNYDELEKLRERLVQASQHRPRSKVQEILDRLLGRVDAKLKLKPQPKSISEKEDRGKVAWVLTRPSSNHSVAARRLSRSFRGKVGNLTSLRYPLLGIFLDGSD